MKTLFKKYSIITVLIAFPILTTASCKGGDSDLPLNMDYIKSVEVKNKHTRNIKLDNFARFIDIEIDKDETKDNVVVSLVLADGVSMVSPASAEAEYNLEKPATIRLSTGKREVSFKMSAKIYDPGTDPGTDPEPKAKPRFIWIDAAANFPDFANSKDNILRDLAIAKNTGFTDVVVDVRPNSGDVLFATNVVEQVKWLGAWIHGTYSRVDRTATWDYLQAFIDAGHTLGLKVHAGINVMVGGNQTSLGGSGMLFRDASKRGWATELLTETGIVNILDAGNSAKFFNPVHEDVQEFLCQLLDDLASYPDLDGIILDRCRFDDIGSDFSNTTRLKFEKYLGQTLQNWPGDVMRPGISSWNALPKPLPPHFKKWLEFRVKTIHDFMDKARARVKAKNPDMSFGVYVGGWYAAYFGVGVNWASKKYNTASYYSDWATSDYQKYGFADLMDVILIGAYASPTSIYGSSEWTVQGFCTLAKEKIKGDAPVVGGPDVGNGEGAKTDVYDINKAITQSVDAAINAGDGYFLFDMIHLKNKNQWQYVKEGIDKYLKSIEK